MQSLNEQLENEKIKNTYIKNIFNNIINTVLIISIYEIIKFKFNL